MADDPSVPSLSLSQHYQDQKFDRITRSTKVKRIDVAPGIELRIQPLGDSITYGFKSSHGNGYRLQLLNDLSGSKEVYVGSGRNGDMADNFNEGQ